MLVLSRKEGEEIIVPECSVTVSVLGIEGNRVRLGISAPPEVEVRRGEQLRRVPKITFSHQGAAVAVSEDPLIVTRVLIADTDEYLLETYRQYLSEHGFDVLTATGGVECVEKLRERVPDVLVLEPSLPWGGGDGVLAMMHEDSDVPLVPVLVLTYGRDRGVLYRLAPFRVDDYQAKPLSAKQLAQRIRAITRQRQLEALLTVTAGQIG